MTMAAQDGTMHHSASRARLHDELSTKKGPATEEPAKGAQPNPGPHNAPTKTPIEEHVGLHGPATAIGHMHHEASGTHHVTSHHGDGPPHHSRHKSHKEAHEHMGKAMGVTGENEETETPDEGAEEYAGGGESSGSMPGVSEQ